MRILVVQETDWIERGPHQQHHLFERLETMGHEVRVVDFEFLWRETDSSERYRGREEIAPESQIVDDAEISLIRPAMLKFPLLDKASILPAHSRELNRQFDEFQPDVVVGFGILNAYLAARLAGANDVPFVYYLIDHLHTLLSNRALQRVAKIVESRAVKRADFVYTINEGLREYAVNLGADPAVTRVVPGGVDVDRYREGDSDTVDLPVDIGDDETVLFFMGWLYEFSGLRELAQDLAATDEHDDLKLVVVGEGDLYDELKEIKQDQLGDQLVLTGRVPFEEIPNYLDYADVCLLPAEHNETMHDIVPIKMYEYLSSGSPVVATRLPGLEKEFGEESGVVYTDGPNDAFDTILDLLESDEYDARVREGLRYADKHDWTRLAEQFENHLEMVTDGSDPPSRDSTAIPSTE
ncbi:glycosyltransferase [Halosimplex salinum]|uniref:glycosyltransferase n=1 Tax=Halosimplex salinum TaxID=1710538 RepID=UPI000F49C4B2|nr:glycosyltransferase [Halosimplex salinum]